MTYRAAPVTQRDGSELASSNCLMAAAAVGLDYHTLGAKRSTGSAMREHSGDTSGGTNSDEVKRAWDRGYHEHASVRDGNPWSQVRSDLDEGRVVMLQVWHATVGKVCLSGSGAYGHGITVAPERDGDRWLVADPWCKPPSWAWVPEPKLRAGAEEWIRHSASGALGVYGREWPDPRTIPLELLRRAATELMARYRPGRPSPYLRSTGAGGSPGVLFVSTRAHGGATDVTINANGSRLVSARQLRCGDGLNFYADAELTKQLGELGQERVLPYIGPAVGPAPGLAVLLNTSTPYDDGQDRPSIVYVNPDHVTDPEPVPEDPEDPVAARDAQWRAWLDGDGDAPDRQP